MSDFTTMFNQQQRQDKVKQTKRLATGLLFLMGLLFIITHQINQPGFWIQLLQSVSEAGMVGGLADWFAVTALFQHPLGIPIPHTALVPRNKDKIGKNLGNFFATHFMKEELVREKLRSLDTASRIGDWLIQKEHSAFLTHYLSTAIPHVLDIIKEERFMRLAQSLVNKQIHRIDLARIVSGALKIVVSNNRHQRLMDQILLYVHELLLNERKAFNRMVGEQARWWVPRAVDKEVARMVLDGVLQLLEDLNDEHHEVRQRFDRATKTFISELESSNAFQTRLTELRTLLMENIELKNLLDEVWQSLKQSINEHSADSGSQLQLAVSDTFEEFGKRIQQDPALRQSINHQLESLVIHLFLPWRHEIGNFIAEVVRQWDVKSLTRQIELEVGSDLQYIRINGTIMGALLGSLLFFLK